MKQKLELDNKYEAISAFDAKRLAQESLEKEADCVDKEFYVHEVFIPRLMHKIELAARIGLTKTAILNACPKQSEEILKKELSKLGYSVSFMPTAGFYNKTIIDWGNE